VTGFARASGIAVLLAVAAIALAGLLAGGVRVLPWLLDPAVPWRVAGPFARGLAAVAVESALLAGWPLGWSIACFGLVESGEARVLQTLGERPLSTVARLAPQGALLALLLAAVAVVYGRDAGAPGRVATELLARSRGACAVVTAPATYVIPFTNLTWLCAPGRQPRLVGSLSGLAPSSSVLSADRARIAGDFRALELDDARVLIDGPPPIALHVASLSIRGLPAWAQASSLPAPLRALVLALSGWIAASLGAYTVLRRAAETRAGVLLIGAVGPLSALGLMRLFERMSARPMAFAMVPVAGGACTLVLGAILSRRGGAARAVQAARLRSLALRIRRRAASS
jgi:hypothetical protein